jgi:16S rRNA (guanine527-N7)-methyltransferase
MELGSAEWKDTIRRGQAAFGISLTEESAELFALHARELLAWNRKTNLTAITDPYEMAVKHFIDSLAPVPMIRSGASLLDIGTGGGFPGVPLKIALPGIRATLVDASRKKVSFLSHLIRRLGLTEITARQVRAEALRDAADRFDVVISRAVASLEEIIVYGMPLLARQGRLIAMKGGEPEADERKIRGIADRALSGSGIPAPVSIRIHRYRLPFVEAERSLIVFEGG